MDTITKEAVGVISCAESAIFSLFKKLAIRAITARARRMNTSAVYARRFESFEEFAIEDIAYTPKDTARAMGIALLHKNLLTRKTSAPRRTVTAKNGIRGMVFANLGTLVKLALWSIAKIKSEKNHPESAERHTAGAYCFARQINLFISSFFMGSPHLKIRMP